MVFTDPPDRRVPHANSAHHGVGKPPSVVSAAPIASSHSSSTGLKLPLPAMTLVTPVSVVMLVAGLRRQNDAALLHVSPQRISQLGKAG
ncbi:MAG: hypothetical protein WBE66_18080 [Mycobacterium sp.]